MSLSGVGSYLDIVKRVLSKLGFSPAPNTTRGLSGYEHTFDLAARKGDKIIYISVKSADPKEIILEQAKAIDVKNDVILIVIGSLPSTLLQAQEGKRVKLLQVGSLDELTDKIAGVLSEY